MAALITGQSNTPRIRDLKGLGPKSELQMHELGITSVEAFKDQDPFSLYASLKTLNGSISLNYIYAIIGAQEDVHWQTIAKERKTEILQRLDELNLL